MPVFSSLFFLTNSDSVPFTEIDLQPERWTQTPISQHRCQMWLATGCIYPHLLPRPYPVLKTHTNGTQHPPTPIEVCHCQKRDAAYLRQSHDCTGSQNGPRGSLGREREGATERARVLKRERERDFGYWSGCMSGRKENDLPGEKTCWLQAICRIGILRLEKWAKTKVAQQVCRRRSLHLTLVDASLTARSTEQLRLQSDWLVSSI